MAFCLLGSSDRLKGQILSSLIGSQSGFVAAFDFKYEEKATG